MSAFECDCSAPEIAETYREILNRNGTNWMLITYADDANKVFRLAAKGEDGLEGLRNHLNDSFVGFGCFSVICNGGNFATRVKLVFFKFCGKQIPLRKKAIINLHYEEVLKLFPDVNTSFSLESGDELIPHFSDSLYCYNCSEYIVRYINQRWDKSMNENILRNSENIQTKLIDADGWSAYRCYCSYCEGEGDDAPFPSYWIIRKHSF